MNVRPSALDTTDASKIVDALWLGANQLAEVLPTDDPNLIRKAVRNLHPIYGIIYDLTTSKDAGAEHDPILPEELLPRLQALAAEAQSNPTPILAQQMQQHVELLKKWQHINATERGYMDWAARRAGDPPVLPNEVAALDSLVDEIVQPRFSPERDAVVLVGGACGRLVERLRARGVKRVIVYAPGEAISAAQHVGAVLTDTADAIGKSIFEYGSLAPGHVVIHPIPGCDVEDTVLQDIGAACDKALQAQGVTQSTLDRFGADVIRQTLRNLPAIAKGATIRELREAFHGIPCVLVNAGPSLDKNIDVLKAMQNRCMILAGSRSLPALLKAGISPHLAMVVDPQPLNYHFDNLDPKRLPPLALAVAAAPELSALPVPRFYFSANRDLDSWSLAMLGQEAPLATGGSVSTGLASLAIEMGCNPIILIGQDLAYTGDRMYASGAPDSAAHITRRGESIIHSGTDDWNAHQTKIGGQTTDHWVLTPLVVEGYDGGSVTSHLSMIIIRDWFEIFSRQHSDRALINATEGGARIPGWVQRSLRDTLESAPSLAGGTFAPLTKVAPQGDAELQRRALARSSELLKTFDKLIAQAHQCHKVAKQARTNAARIDAFNAELKRFDDILNPVRWIQFVRQADARKAIEQSARAVTTREQIDARDARVRALREATQDARPWLVEAIGNIQK